MPLTVGDLPEPSNYKVYPQQDALNIWQAGSVIATGRVQVDLIDWGDNLESVDWYTKSKVRTEVVLFEDTTVNSPNDDAPEYEPMTQYLLKHVSGWGITELWGLSTTVEPFLVEEVPNVQSTVYSPCARLTIQKLMVPRENPLLATNLTWVPEEGWTENDPLDNLINGPIFNGPVWQTGDVNKKK